MFLCLLIAISSFSIRGLGLAGASYIMSGGSTSGIPPTFVETQSRPQDAASRIAMQKASVRDVFKKMWPLQSTSRTWLWGREPKSSTLSAMLYLSLISRSRAILGPSPPMMKCTLECLLIISGIIITSRSTPFLNVSLHMLTMLIVFIGDRRDGFGVNLKVSTELGMT